MQPPAHDAASLVLLAFLAAGCRSGGNTPASATPSNESTRTTDAGSDDVGTAAADAGVSPAADAGAPGDASAPPLAGGWSSVATTDPAVVAAAQAAVAERQRQQGGAIRLVSVAWAQGQVVAGMNYRLGLEVTVNGAAQQVTAVVWSQAWRHSNQLTSWTQGFARP